METIPLPQLGFLRGVFLANHLASTDNLIRTTKRRNTHTNANSWYINMVPNKQQHSKRTMLRYVTDRTRLSRLFTTSGHETEWIYSYNPRVCMGPSVSKGLPSETFEGPTIKCIVTMEKYCKAQKLYHYQSRHRKEKTSSLTKFWHAVSNSQTHPDHFYQPA